jgi:hypothetical protein
MSWQLVRRLKGKYIQIERKNNISFSFVNNLEVCTVAHSLGTTGLGVQFQEFNITPYQK